MTKQQVDTLKGVAILEVVTIHFLAIFPEAWWLAYDARSMVFVVVDQLCRMSIPLFIFLSWYGLSKKYHGERAPLISFWQSRIVKLIPLYLIWAVGIWVMMEIVPNWRFNMEIPLYLKILMGQADYHLYFIPLIIMLYFLFGFYTYIPKYLKLIGTIAVGALTIWWYGYIPIFRTHFTWIQPDQISYLVPLTWFWYAWLGGIAADFNFSERLSRPNIKKVLLVVTLLAMAWMFTDAYRATHSTVWESVLAAMEFTRWPVLAFATSVILLLVSTVGHWGNRKTIFSTIGVFSFFVFLAHTTLIRLIPEQFLHPVPTNQWLFGAGITIFLLLLSTAFMA